MGWLGEGTYKGRHNVGKSLKKSYIIYEWSFSLMDLYFDTNLGLFYMSDATYVYTFYDPYDPWISEQNCTYINYTIITDDITTFQFNCTVNEWYYGFFTLVLTFTPGAWHFFTLV